MKALQNPVFLQSEIRREQNCFSDGERSLEFAIYAGIMRKYEGMFFFCMLGRSLRREPSHFFARALMGIYSMDDFWSTKLVNFSIF